MLIKINDALPRTTSFIVTSVSPARFFRIKVYSPVSDLLVFLKCILAVLLTDSTVILLASGRSPLLNFQIASGTGQPVNGIDMDVLSSALT